MSKVCVKQHFIQSSVCQLFSGCGSLLGAQFRNYGNNVFAPPQEDTFLLIVHKAYISTERGCVVSVTSSGQREI